MHWPRKTRPNLHSRVVANSMIMVGSVQEIDHDNIIDDRISTGIFGG